MLPLFNVLHTSLYTPESESLARFEYQMVLTNNIVILFQKLDQFIANIYDPRVGDKTIKRINLNQEEITSPIEINLPFIAFASLKSQSVTFFNYQNAQQLDSLVDEKLQQIHVPSKRAKAFLNNSYETQLNFFRNNLSLQYLKDKNLLLVQERVLKEVNQVKQYDHIFTTYTLDTNAIAAQIVISDVSKIGSYHTSQTLQENLICIWKHSQELEFSYRLWNVFETVENLNPIAISEKICENMKNYTPQFVEFVTQNVIIGGNEGGGYAQIIECESLTGNLIRRYHLNSIHPNVIIEQQKLVIYVDQLNRQILLVLDFQDEQIQKCLKQIQLPKNSNEIIQLSRLKLKIIKGCRLYEEDSCPQFVFDSKGHYFLEYPSDEYMFESVSTEKFYNSDKQQHMILQGVPMKKFEFKNCVPVPSLFYVWHYLINLDKANQKQYGVAILKDVTHTLY